MNDVSRRVTDYDMFVVCTIVLWYELIGWYTQPLEFFFLTKRHLQYCFSNKRRIRYCCLVFRDHSCKYALESNKICVYMWLHESNRWRMEGRFSWGAYDFLEIVLPRENNGKRTRAWWKHSYTIIRPRICQKRNILCTDTRLLSDRVIALSHCQVKLKPPVQSRCSHEDQFLLAL